MRLFFDSFEIDLDGRQLIREGKEVPLERRVVDMLIYLAVHPGRLVEKEELLAEVWQARTLSDGVLANAASKLRKALGQAAQAHSPLETVHGRGYRWRAVERPKAGAALSSVVVGPGTDGSEDPFVGRLAVMETLVGAAERVSRGRGQLVLLRGEAGIGKSRTMRELSNHARQRGFRSWLGIAYEAEGAPAYWPWVQILRASRAELSEEVWRRHVPTDSWALPLVLPELGEPARPASGVDVQAVRFQLFDELSRFLASASAGGPILAAIEDLHAADSGTVELLAHLARALEPHAVLLVATVRDFARAEDESHVAAMGRLERIATSVRLSGLSKDEIATLVDARPGTKGAEVAEVLFTRTRGNPFFIRQLLDLLLQRGQPIDSDNLAATELPTAVLDTIRRRLATLDDDARAVLAVASVIGQEFDARLLADVTGNGLEQVLTALDPSLRMGMLATEPTIHRFAFTHGLLRDTLYEDLGLPERGTLHGRLANILAARPNRDARHLGEVARHHLLAVPSDPDACVRHCGAAADAARQASGFDAAAAFLSRVLKKLESEGGDDRIRCELLHQVSLDHFCAGNVRAGWRALGQGLRVARQLGEPRLVARFACSLVDWLELGGFNEVDARAAIDEALLTDDGEMRAGLLARRARLGFELPVSERTALLDEATRLAERSSALDPLLDVAICRALSWNPTRTEDGRAAIAAVRAIVAEHPAVTMDPRFPLVRLTVDLTEYLHALVAGDSALANQVAARCAASAERLPQALGPVVEMMRAGRALREGRLDDLDASVQRLRESATESGGLSRVWFFYAFLSSEARDDIGTWNGIDLGDPSFLRELPTRQHTAAHLWLAWFYVKTGRFEKARRFLAEVPASELVRMPVQHGDLGLLGYLAEIYRAGNDLEGATWLRDKLMPYAALHAIGPAFEDRGPVAKYIDALTSMIGDE